MNIKKTLVTGIFSGLIMGLALFVGGADPHGSSTARNLFPKANFNLNKLMHSISYGQNWQLVYFSEYYLPLFTKDCHYRGNCPEPCKAWNTVLFFGLSFLYKAFPTRLFTVQLMWKTSCSGKSINYSVSSVWVHLWGIYTAKTGQEISGMPDQGPGYINSRNFNFLNSPGFL